VAVIGHKPPELGGYGANPVADGVAGQAGRGPWPPKAQLHPDLVVAHRASASGPSSSPPRRQAAAGVPYVAVLPYPDPDSMWPAESRRHFVDLTGGAQGTVVLQTKTPATKQLAGRRPSAGATPGWPREADEAVAVWDGVDPGIGRAVRAPAGQPGRGGRVGPRPRRPSPTRRPIAGTPRGNRRSAALPARARGGVVRRGGLLGPAEPAQEVGPEGVEEVVVGQVQRLDDGQGGARGPWTSATATARLRATTGVGATVMSWS